jgi:thymidylate synthase
MKPYVIEAADTNEAFKKICQALLTDGQSSSPRGQLTLELRNAWVSIENPGDGVCTLPARATDIEYLNGELAWYLSGSLNVADIEKHSKFWTKLADTNGTVNSNYGFLALIEKHAGKSQLEWVIDSLKDDPDTRQAVINYNQPRHKYKGNKDFVCTLTQEFRAADNKLDSHVHMRSNDLIFGLTYDLPWFVGLQRRAAKEAGLEVGSYSHQASSLHIYERHFEMARLIADS